jgi:flagellar biosynthesis/type III secretory pathway protein FliH
MPVIKVRDAECKIAQAEVLRFQDVEVEAQRVLADARLQAEAILVEARARAERLRADAHATGGETGRTEGLRTGAELGRKQALDQAKTAFATQHAAIAKALAAALEQFDSRRRSLLAEMERDVIALAGAIANRVIKRVVDIDPACVTGNVREALQLVARKNRLEIRLHPEDLEQVRRFAQDLLPAQEFESVGFVPDESVARGGVLLRTAGGQVDATIETQWTRILDEILAGWQEHWLLSPALLSADAPAGNLEMSCVDSRRQDAAPPLAQQALIDEAIAQAMGTLARPRGHTQVESDTGPAQGPLVEEIDPSEVEEIDPNDAAQ